MTQRAALRGVPLASEIRATGLEGTISRQSANRIREAATIDANSKLEFALAYNGGAATFNGPSAVLQFDQASSPGYVLVSDTTDQIIAAPGSNVTVYSNANFTLPSNVDTLKLDGGDRQ